MIEFKNIIGMPMDQDIDLEDLEFQKYDLDLIDIDADINYALLNNKDSRISQLNTDIVEKQEKIYSKSVNFVLKIYKTLTLL